MSIADFYAFAFVCSYAMNKKGAEKQAHLYAALNAEIPKFANFAKWIDTMNGEGFAEYIEARPSCTL